MALKAVAWLAFAAIAATCLADSRDKKNRFKKHGSPEERLAQYRSMIQDEVKRGPKFVAALVLGGKDLPLSVGNSTLAPFKIQRTTVTNGQFRQFVRKTSYKTEAEQFGWSFVFKSHVSKKTLAGVTQTVEGANWWLPVRGAYWRQPAGPGSTIKHKLDYPVTHVSLTDAKAFCAWAGGRLPTEQEWEAAARGDLAAILEKHAGAAEKNGLPWGRGNPQRRMNYFQGTFPGRDLEEDGHGGLAPVGVFPPQNQLGIENMLGNGWEWVDSRYTDGPGRDAKQEQWVLRGGSYIDSIDGAHNHKIDLSTRMPNTADAGSDNLAFRCAFDLDRKQAKAALAIRVKTIRRMARLAAAGESAGRRDEVEDEDDEDRAASKYYEDILSDNTVEELEVFDDDDDDEDEDEDERRWHGKEPRAGKREKGRNHKKGREEKGRRARPHDDL